MGQLRAVSFVVLCSSLWRYGAAMRAPGCRGTFVDNKAGRVLSLYSTKSATWMALAMPVAVLGLSVGRRANECAMLLVENLYPD